MNGSSTGDDIARSGRGFLRGPDLPTRTSGIGEYRAEAPRKEGTMPWVRLDESLLHDERFLTIDLPDRAAYLAIVLAGTRAAIPGQWMGRSWLTEAVPRWVEDEHIANLIEVGLLVEDEHPDGKGGTVRVADEAIYRPLTPAERSAAHRARVTDASRGRNGNGNANRHEPSLSFSSTSSSENDDATSRAGAREGFGGLDDDWFAIASLAEALTGQPYALGDPYGRLGERVRRMVAKHGLDQTSEAMTRAAAAAGPMPEVGQVVLGAGNALDAIPRVGPPEKQPVVRPTGKAWTPQTPEPGDRLAH